MKKIFAGIFVLICAVTLFACDGTSNDQFGHYTHNGYALTSFANSTISYTEADNMLKANSNFTNAVNSNYSSKTSSQVLTNEEMDNLMLKYSSVTITTKYWDGSKQITRNNTIYLSSADTNQYPDILTSNRTNIGNELFINNIIVTPELLQSYEQINIDWKAEGGDKNAPFSNRYEYRTNSNNKFVLEIGDYSTNNNNPSGTSTMEIHQTQSKYNLDNLIVAYQASFGFTYATPGNTEDIGTVLEATFEWHLKK